MLFYGILCYRSREYPVYIYLFIYLFMSAIERCVARMGERRGVYRVMVEKPEGKRQLGRPRRR